MAREGDVLGDGRYEVLGVVGHGGQGEVVKARDTRHDRVVAIKLRPAGAAKARDRLLAEAGILLSLSPHPGLPVVREDFFEGNHYAIAMDWIDGADLHRILAEQGSPGLGPTVVITWLAQAADALEHLHTHEPPVVHGDVKPGNCVLSRAGRVVLVDFGIAQRGKRRAGGSGGKAAPGATTTRTRTRTGTLAGGGTAGFVAPEVTAGETPTPAADIYGLAATANALLTGAPPPEGSLNGAAVPPKVARLLQQALRRALSVDPAQRPSSARELVDRLRAALLADLPTGTVTFLATETHVAPSAWDDDADGTAAMLARHDQLVAEAVEANGGRLVRTQGESESTLSVFAEPSRAAVAAVALHESMRELPLELQAAVHTGDAQLRGEDYSGPTVARVARLRALAKPGQVLVSAVSADTIGGAVPEGAELKQLGRQPLLVTDTSEHVYGLSHPSLASVAALAPATSGAPRKRWVTQVSVAAVVALVAGAIAFAVTRDNSSPTAAADPRLSELAPSVTRPILVSSQLDGRARLYRLDERFAPVLVSEGLDAGANETIYPTYSRDGKSMAFVQLRAGGGFDIWSAAPDGTAARQLTFDAGFDVQPGLSPDGASFAWTSNRGDGIYRIYAGDTRRGETGGVRRLSTRKNTGEPAYSPDGARVAFGSDQDIFVVDANATDQPGTQLTTSKAIDFGAAWSPDGKSIAFVSTRAGKAELFVMSADGEATSLRQVTAIGRHAGAPEWSGDGKWILFVVSDDWDAPQDIAAVPSSGTKVEDPVMVFASPAHDSAATW